MRMRSAAAAGCAALWIMGAAPATAEPSGCTTADMTAVMSGVSAALSAYLFTHPEVNDFFSGLQGMPKDQVRRQTEDYLNTNPDVRADLDAVRAPSLDFRARCNLPQRAMTLADNL